MMDKAINKKYLEQIEEINKRFTRTYKGEICVDDNETYHIAFDDMLVDMLNELGYGEITSKYNEASNHFWYS